MFLEDLEYKGKVIPQCILGYGPFMAELYYGHRSRLYLDDLYNNPQNTSEVIIEAYNQGVRAINLVNDSKLLEAYDLAVSEGCEMKVIATIGKSDVEVYDLGTAQPTLATATPSSGAITTFPALPFRQAPKRLGGISCIGVEANGVTVASPFRQDDYRVLLDNISVSWKSSAFVMIVR